ncbi:LysM peptidoglycan-binding domain-containing protein [Jatrophihabitans endophyticus]|uniref:LysM peptidoglycan-binding domain-containing protein n=1 Tax=Jatrophihabitans endophyticus TaxID=1206085 RepID=UPI0019F08255|nr:hypothetical protein [Jatrophihabitans endophyticus]MBE7187828.1 hypothetical protein [Jatrophihabitans endophyticus]
MLYTRSVAARAALLATADAAVLGLVRPRPRQLKHIAAHPVAALRTWGADGVVAVVASAALWAAAAWIAVGLLAALGSHLPGLAGRACRAATTVVLPAAVRKVVIGAVGVGLVVGPSVTTGTALAATTAASSAPRPPGVAAAYTGVGSRRPGPGPAWPTSSPHHPDRPGHDRPPRRQPSGTADTIRVRAGDSLWVIAARRLGADATPARTAAYWPRVYEANRSVIGPDPGLVTPGQVLDLPDPPSS